MRKGKIFGLGLWWACLTVASVMLEDLVKDVPLYQKALLVSFLAAVALPLMFMDNIKRWKLKEPKKAYVHNHETISISERVESKLIKPPGRMTRAFRALLRFFRFDTPTEESSTLLSDAMLRAWQMKEIRELPEFQTLARERPQDIYRRLAERIFDGRDPSLSIRGVIGEPPLDQIVESPHEYTFANDLVQMTHIADDGRCYRDLRVSWPDVEASIRRRMGEVQ